MPLTQAEMAFIQARILEGFHLDDPEHPACEAYRKLGLSHEDFCKDHEFKYLWQEQGQIDIFTETGLLKPTPAPCPWPDAKTFLRRWDEILPESMSLCFEKNHNPHHYRQRIEIQSKIWGAVEINPFTDGAAEFLDALAIEVRSRTFGPCLRAVVERSIHHFYTLSLIERRWFELTERGQSWPQPHLPDPPCPWQDRQAFEDRFDRELKPYPILPHDGIVEGWHPAFVFKSRVGGVRPTSLIRTFPTGWQEGSR